MMQGLLLCFCAASLLRSISIESFQPTSRRAASPGSRRARPALPSPVAALRATNAAEADLKAQLAEYLTTREDANADDAAQAEVGTVIGGTRGNAVLEYVSGSPNKQRVREEVPDVFDYDELIKYGYSALVTPVMENGGRRAMYRLMDLPEPATPARLTKKKSAPKLVIDRTGAADTARYAGLKMAQATDDEALGRALEEAQRKVKEGKSLRKRLVEEDYVMPYADSTNVGPRETPQWTPEMLDEAGRKAGEAQAWARRARMGELKKDPFEALAVEGELRTYSVFAAVTVALGLGRATPTALGMLGVESPDILDVLRIPALALVLVGLGSAVVSGAVIAPPKRRSSFVWGVKGLMGGPLAIRQLRELDDLITVGESEER